VTEEQGKKRRRDAMIR